MPALPPRAAFAALFTSLLLLCALQSSRAGAALPWADGDYDPAIPSLEQVLGYAPGERITWSADARRYFEALVAAAPERIRLHEYGQSWEGRPLFYVAISAAENLARSDEIRGGMRALADPQATNPAAAQAIIERQPAVTWLAYGVHGNEISSTDAAMVTAYHLLASRDDERVAGILRDTVVIINPMQNPDGRDRFIHRFEMALGLEASAERLSAEHNEPWPSGRTNHYLFDLNRDWFIRSQPETRGHADAVRQWLPVAFVDLHEMGSDSTYYFAPEAVPYNPHLAAAQRASLELFGRTNAGWFDRFGIDYFTREVYDAFYPGYGASWPSYFGSVAMTYEQASARGLVVRRSDGSEMPYADTVRNHFLTSMGTAETVAVNRGRLLRDFYDYQRSAVEEGRSEALRAYVLPAQADQDAVDRLGALLVAQGARVGRATVAFRACGGEFEAGSLVINLDQPAKRLLRTLLDRQVPMEPDFLAEQERRRAKNLPDEMYDVTAWSLPLLFNIDSVACDRLVGVSTEPVAADTLPTPAAPPRAAVAYLVPWGERPALRFLGRALRAGLSLKSSDRAFTHGGRRYPAGTLIVDVADNPPDLHQRLAALVDATRAEVVAVDDSWVSAGPNFGSRRVVTMPAPRIALAWDEPVSAYSAGNLRFVLERQFDYPVTPVRVADLAGADLSRFQVLILPERYGAGYAAAFDESDLEKLHRWVRRGGVLLTVGRATRLLTHPALELLPTRREYALQESDSAAADDEDDGRRAPGLALTRDDYAAAIESQDADPPSFGGAILRAAVDPDHWLGAGVASQLHLMARNADSYRPLRLDDGVNVVRFAPADELLASGHLWETSRRQLALKPAVMARAVGRGQVIGFTQDPAVRAYQAGLNVLLANAVFRAAAHARPTR